MTYDSDAAGRTQQATGRRPVSGAHCALCGRSARLSFHHLIPRKNHRKAWYQRHFSKAEMTGRGLWLCRECHSAVHRFFDEQTLGRRLNTHAALLEEPAIRAHIAWASKLRTRR